MAIKKISTDYSGIRYREHASRMCGRKPDRYYYIRYRPERGGKQREEGIGWTSQGWSPRKVFEDVLSPIQRACDTGKGPRSLKEMREAVRLTEAEITAKAVQKEKQGITFAEVAARFVLWAKDNKASWKDDESRLRLHVIPRLGEKPMTAITTTDIERMKNQLKRVKPKRGRHTTMRPATITQCLAVTRTVFNFAMETPLRGDNPDVMIFTGRNPARMSSKFRGGVRPLKFDNRRMRIYTTAELGKLLEATCVSSQDLHDITLLALDVGIRRREVVALRPEFFIRDSMALKIFDPKNGQTRTVFIGSLIPKAAVMMLNRMQRLPKKANWIFPGRWGDQRDMTSITRQIGVVCGWLGINKGISDDRMRAVFHTLRHTHATLMLEKGVDIYSLKELMGHEDIAVTERYLHLCDQVKREKAFRGGGVDIN